MIAKVVVIGSVNGQLRALFKKLSSLQAKNPFSIAITCGDLFADPATYTEADEEDVAALLDGSIQVPLPTYFSLGLRPLPAPISDRLASSSGEVCENMFYLGKQTALSTADGLKIVALGGQLDRNISAGTSKDQFTPFYTYSDVEALRNVKNTDILLTSEWPSKIYHGSNQSLPEGVPWPTGSDIVASLCSSLKPRYHFSSSPDFFLEREPFFHKQAEDDPTSYMITRFISLASFGNHLKQKWLYAFSIDTEAKAPPTLPVGVTASPFSTTKHKPALPSQDASYSRFARSDGPRPSKRARRAPPGPEECFFCLANPNLATHLIASVGDDSYLTTARGPLSSSETNQSIKFSGHILIIPLSHSSTLSDIPDVPVRSSAFAEMTRYRHQLQSMIEAESKGDLGSVTWELSRRRGVHAHWQFLPVSQGLLAKDLVTAAFKVEAENESYGEFEVHHDDAIDPVNGRGDFFRVWIRKASSPAEGTPQKDELSGPATNDQAVTSNAEETVLVLPLAENSRLDAQFGRRVMAKLLGLEDRLNWKDCLQSEEDEVKDVNGLKSAFKPFDFTS